MNPTIAKLVALAEPVYAELERLAKSTQQAAARDLAHREVIEVRIRLNASLIKIAALHQLSGSALREEKPDGPLATLREPG